MSESAFKNILQDLEKARMHLLFNSALSVICILAVVILICWIFHIKNPLAAVFIFIIPSFLWAIFFLYGWLSTYQQSFGANLLKPWINYHYPKFQYSNESSLGKVEFLFSGFNSEIIKRFSAGYTLQGKVQNSFLCCSEISVVGKPTKRYPNRKVTQEEGKIEVFNGLFIIWGNRNSKSIDSSIANTIIVPKGICLEDVKIELTNDLDRTIEKYTKDQTEFTMVDMRDRRTEQLSSWKWEHTIQWEKQQKISTGNSAFDEAFNLYGKNSEETRRIVSNTVQIKLLALQKEWGKDVYFSIAQSRCYAAFTKDKNTLRPSYFVPIGSSLESRLSKDMETIFFALMATDSIASTIHEADLQK